MRFEIYKDIRIEKVTANSDREVRRDFVKLMNKFRDEYHDGSQGPYDMNTLLDQFTNRQDITCFNIYKHNTNIGILEFCTGELGNKHTLDLATIYIVPKYRKNNLSKYIYDMIQNGCDELGVAYNTHIEDTKFIGNEQKFMKLGFTHYIKTKHKGYVGETYCLFRKPYFKLLMPIK